jgi:hypothetical protein
MTTRAKRTLRATERPEKHPLTYTGPATDLSRRSEIYTAPDMEVVKFSEAHCAAAERYILTLDEICANTDNFPMFVQSMLERGGFFDSARLTLNDEPRFSSTALVYAILYSELYDLTNHGELPRGSFKRTLDKVNPFVASRWQDTVATGVPQIVHIRTAKSLVNLRFLRHAAQRWANAPLDMVRRREDATFKIDYSKVK